MLAVLALGLTQLNSDLTTGNMFRDDVDSVQGQELVEAGFPAGANGPTNVLVTDPSKVDDVRSGARRCAWRVRGRRRPSKGRPAPRSRRRSTGIRSAPPRST